MGGVSNSSSTGYALIESASQLSIHPLMNVLFIPAVKTDRFSSSYIQ